MASGSHMRHSIKHILAAGGLCAAMLAVLGCAPRRIPPLTVEDLMEDRVTLDGVLLKCDQDPTKVRNPSDCENARIANERLAAQRVDPEVEKRRQAEFEKAREQLRLAQDKLRQEQEAQSGRLHVTRRAGRSRRIRQGRCADRAGASRPERTTARR
jgi:hypothetical protein